MGGSGGYSQSSSRTKIDKDQKRFLKDLWRQAQSLTGEISPDVSQGISQGLIDRYLPGAEAGAGVFGQVAQGTAPGQDILLQSAQQENPYLQGAIANLGSDITRNLSENLLPALRTGGIAAGAPGGSRTQIAEGLAAQGAQRQFAQQATQLRAQDLIRQQSAAQAYTGNQLAGAQGALGAAPQLYNLGFAPTQAAYFPLQQYGSLLGNPTVLGKSSAFSLYGGGGVTGY